MLIVEIDGDTHVGQEAYDTVRTRYFEQKGYQVVRYANADVMTNLEGVLTELAGVIAPPPLPTPSPEGERA